METVKIEEVLLPEMTILDRETFADKDELFTFMSERFYENGITTDAGKFKEALLEREEEGSTYIGNLLALPHGICDEVLHPGVGFCRVDKPFLYESHGEKGEVKYIFTMAIVGANGKTEHLRILATLAQLLAHEEFIDALGQVQSYEELMEAVRQIQKTV